MVACAFLVESVSAIFRIPITTVNEVEALVAELSSAPNIAFDLEFMSESRYVPELALLQVGWGEEPSVAVVDPLAVDVLPILHWLASGSSRVSIHAAQGDLSLIGARYNLSVANLLDTQLAAAFLGYGDQIGYATLAARVLGVELDKGMQWTEWLARPLTAEQLRYAADDVRYLAPLSARLVSQLEAAGRLSWVLEESALLAATAARRPGPEEAYQRLGGWQRLAPRQLGVLREVAAWREREALRTNRPPSWIAKNNVVVEIARRMPASRDDLRKVKDLPAHLADRYGNDLLRAVRQGRAAPLMTDHPGRLSTTAKRWSGDMMARVQERAAALELASRLLATRGDLDALAGWWSRGNPEIEPDLPLLRGWRRELIGAELLAWLATQPVQREL